MTSGLESNPGHIDEGCVLPPLHQSRSSTVAFTACMNSLSTYGKKRNSVTVPVSAKASTRSSSLVDSLQFARNRKKNVKKKQKSNELDKKIDLSKNDAARHLSLPYSFPFSRLRPSAWRWGKRCAKSLLSVGWKIRHRSNEKSNSSMHANVEAYIQLLRGQSTWLDQNTRANISKLDVGNCNWSISISISLTHGMLDRWSVLLGGKIFWKFFDPGFLKRWRGELVKSFVKLFSWKETEVTRSSHEITV